MDWGHFREIFLMQGIFTNHFDDGRIFCYKKIHISSLKRSKSILNTLYFFLSAESKENLVIRTCINKDMNSQCGIFTFKEDQIRGCMLTCQEDKCNLAPKLFNGQNIFFFSILFAFLQHM